MENSYKVVLCYLLPVSQKLHWFGIRFYINGSKFPNFANSIHFDSSAAYGRCLEVWLLKGSSLFAHQSSSQSPVSLPLSRISDLESGSFSNPWLCAGVIGPILLWALKLQPLPLSASRSANVFSSVFHSGYEFSLGKRVWVRF